MSPWAETLCLFGAKSAVAKPKNGIFTGWLEFVAHYAVFNE